MRVERVVSLYLGSGGESLRAPIAAGTGARLDWADIASSACDREKDVMMRIGDLVLRARNPREEDHERADHVIAARELLGILNQALVIDHPDLDIAHVPILALAIVYSLMVAKPCMPCDGAGYIETRVVGGARSNMPCSICRQTGKVRPSLRESAEFSGISKSTWHRKKYGDIHDLWSRRLNGAERAFEDSMKEQLG